MKNLDAKSFKEQIEADTKAIIVDVRNPSEEEEGIIDNSININIMDPSFPGKIKALDSSKNYYVYCRSGGRSASACEFMEINGLNTTNLNGGIIAWNKLN